MLLLLLVTDVQILKPDAQLVDARLAIHDVPNEQIQRSVDEEGLVRDIVLLLVGGGGEGRGETHLLPHSVSQVAHNCIHRRHIL